MRIIFRPAFGGREVSRGEYCKPLRGDERELAVALVLADDCFNGLRDDGSAPRLGVEVSEDLLLLFDHDLIQVLIVRRRVGLHL